MVWSDCRGSTPVVQRRLFTLSLSLSKTSFQTKLHQESGCSFSLGDHLRVSNTPPIIRIGVQCPLLWLHVFPILKQFECIGQSSPRPQTRTRRVSQTWTEGLKTVWRPVSSVRSVRGIFDLTVLGSEEGVTPLPTGRNRNRTESTGEMVGRTQRTGEE